MALVQQLRAVASTLYAHSDLYLQLVLIEWAEEKNRLLKLLITLVAGFAFMCCSLISLGVLVLVLSWETAYRVPAAVGLLVFYTVGAVVAYFRVRVYSGRSVKAFADTRREVSADIALIRSKLKP